MSKFLHSNLNFDTNCRNLYFRLCFFSLIFRFPNPFLQDPMLWELSFCKVKRKILLPMLIIYFNKKIYLLFPLKKLNYTLEI